MMRQYSIVPFAFGSEACKLEVAKCDLKLAVIDVALAALIEDAAQSQGNPQTAL
jgi:hypothetical protein